MANTNEIQAAILELDRQIEELQEQRRCKHAELVEAYREKDMELAERAAMARRDAKRVRERH